MNRKFSIILLLTIFVLIASACGGGSVPAPSGETARSAVITLIENDIQVRSGPAAAFAPAVAGQVLAPGAEVQSGADSRTRLELRPEGTVVYVGPNTNFILAQMEGETDSPFTRIRMELGQLWIVLSGGSLEVETPSGVAAVRGSLMGVGSGGNGMTITCLEGHCDYNNGGNTTNMTNGQACDVNPENPDCEPRDMTDDEEQDWEDNVPGSGNYIPPDDPTPTFTPTSEPSPQPTQGASNYGPDDFPPGINPLTGLPVDDPSMLNLPAVLISFTHFPPSARPQAGPGFAPLIYEIYISEGTTRFLVVFYGEEPEFQPVLQGSCEVNTTPFVAGETVLGNYAWFDENMNGVQDASEYGISGLCVSLYDTAGNVLQETATDSNGYYGFNVEAGQTYVVGFEQPDGLLFTLRDSGYDDQDSDADPASGLTAPITIGTTDMNWDAGYFLSDESNDGLTETPGGTQPPGNGSGNGGDYYGGVGPIRSGRLPYRYIRDFFPGSCLVFAGASADVFGQLPGCKLQYGSDEDDINSAMLDLTMLRQLAVNNQNPNVPINYSGNAFSATPPAGGAPASQVDTFWSYLNQTRWIYNPLAGAYERNVNHPDTPDAFAPLTDRLTDRTLLFENLIFIFADHIVQTPTIIDINLQVGNHGPAYLFRNGQMYPIFWSTVAGEYEQETGLMRPMRFEDADGNPIALAPGHTWVHVFTPYSRLEETAPGVWKARFYAPAGSR